NTGHLAGLGGEPREERHQLDLAHAFAQIMLPGPDGIPSAVARQPGHRILAFERCDHVAPGRVLAGEKDSDLHDASKAGQVASSAKLVDDPPAGGKEGRVHPSFPRKRKSGTARLDRRALDPPPTRRDELQGSGRESNMENFSASDGM